MAAQNFSSATAWPAASDNRQRSKSISTAVTVRTAKAS